MHKKIVLLFVMGAMLTFTACGKREKVDMGDVTSEDVPTQQDANKEDSTSSEAVDDTRSGVAEPEYKLSTGKDKIKDRLGVEDMWDEALESSVGEDIDVRIYAGVTVPDVTQMDVTEIEYRNVNTENREEIITSFGFDGIYYRDRKYLSKELIKKELDSLKKERDMMTKDSEAWKKSTKIYESYEDMEKQFASEIGALESAYKDAPEELTVATDFTDSYYLACKNGVLYFVTADANCIRWEPYDDKDVLRKNVEADRVSVTPAMKAEDPYDKIENKCETPIEALEEKAKKYLEDLGYQGFEVTLINDMKWNVYTCEYEYMNEPKESFYDGYYIILRKTVSGVEIADGFNNNMFSFPGEEDVTNINYQIEYVTLAMNDSGVICLEGWNLSKVTDVKAMNVELLNFEQVKERYRNVIKNSHVRGNTDILLKEMKLAYCSYPSPTDNRKHLYIPVWILSDGEDVSEKFVVINAIDGSIIQLDQ
ncbi:MAG: hypothetical protein K2G45_12350 [Lachnospiraceae bacterium]|nr:hypothetical protein [Lachnospiraceae bacterium]